MVVKRQCSFCANEIEPGTGTMFVKRDGSIFHFCSSSCRKQQLHLGRVGHRRKWTRAHAMKKIASHAGGKTGGPLISSTPASPPSPKAGEPAPKEDSHEGGESAPATGTAAPAKEPPAEPAEGTTKDASSTPEEAPAAKPPAKPRRRTPKAAPSDGTDTPPAPPPSS